MANAQPQPPVIFFGTEAWGIPVLEKLSQNFTIRAVITKPDAPSGRRHQLSETPIKSAATRLSLPTIQPHLLSDTARQIQDLNPSIGVVVAYGRLITSAIIALFPYGILNVHPSLLPQYRGPSPIENTILNHDQPGISIIRLTKDMDAGDILYSKSINVSSIDAVTSPQLYTMAGLECAAPLIKCIHNVLNGTATFVPQNHSAASITKLIQKSDGVIDWHKPASRIEAEIRAYLGWPGSRTTLAATDVTITQAHLLHPFAPFNIPGTPFKTASNELAVICGRDALVIDRLKPAGKREMTGPEFLAGRHQLLG